MTGARANLTSDRGATELLRDTVPDGQVQVGGLRRIFANLYRIDSHPRGKSGKVSYSYLLVRKQGNLLICNQMSLIEECLEEIDALGGIDTQLLARRVTLRVRSRRDWVPVVCLMA